LGLPDFEANFDAIMELFKPNAGKDPDKLRLYQFIRANRDKVFISKFPVISSKLRPCLVKGKQVIQDELNLKYLQLTRLVSCYRTLGFDNEPLSVFPLFAKMQQLVNELYESIIESLNGKTGIIRNLMLAGRLNFSSRSVIVPTPLEEAPDAVYVPYIAGLELFKLQVMGRLHREYKMPIEEARVRIENAQREFDETVYDIACEELGEHGFPAILNRNPSIALGSLQKVRITKIKKDPSDYTMNLSVMIFTPLNADLDGDVLNLFLLPNNGSKAFANIRPRLK
jgi:DNA-directed RNA polymerase beta' subunit